MSNYYKTIKKLLAKTPNLSSFLKQFDSYYAHTSPHKKPETLAEHTELVQKKFEELCEIHFLDDVIDAMIHHFVENNFTQKDKHTEIGNFIKKLFVNVVVFHDFGKINVNFQANADKMNNKFFKEISNYVLKTHHSELGAYLFIINHIENDDISILVKDITNAKLIFSFLVLVFSYPIFKHHSKYLNNEIEKKISFDRTKVDELAKYIDCYQFKINPEIPKKINLVLKNTFDAAKSEQSRNNIKNGFDLYNLVRLSFSLLTASDFLASGEYMNDIKIKDFGVLSREKINIIFENIQKTKEYNKNTYQKLENYQFSTLNLVSNDNLNQLREQMTIEVIQNIRKNKDKNLFYIEAPTGGGKTNLSMVATAELLKNGEKLNKVFYVFPFTTLITQTHQAIIETLGLDNNEVVQLHSRASFETKQATDDINNEGEAEYGIKKKNYIDNLFVNYPFCLLTHIKFFDILKTNEKETNYLLHRLANSVVVIDELQSYNPSQWDKIIYFIRQYAHFYNIKFILMSATLPKLDKLRGAENKTNDFVYLLENAKEKYFTNPNFSQRVNFRFDLFENKNIELNELADLLVEKSKQYAQKDFGKYKPKNSVYTVIEFIFKKSATDFYKIINEKQANEPFFDEIFVLSGTVLEHRRKYIINYLKNIDNRKTKILLITTQVVEAGVDIDMDLGFKNSSLIDSDEQLAGRINRNVNKKECELYIFNHNEPSVIYGTDKRYKITKEKINQNDYEDILRNKNFDKLYNLVLEGIEKWNNTDFAIGLEKYEGRIKNLYFDDVNQNFRLIEQQNLSVFVPLSIVIVNNFSENELFFLKEANIISVTDICVEGSRVFDFYIELIENKQSDFINRKIELKILQAIMSKYIFSLFDDSKGKTRKQLICFADIEKINNNFQKHSINDGTTYGFIYLSRYKEIYDEISGLDVTQFDCTDNCIL